jgi:hypothetical protein
VTALGAVALKKLTSTIPIVVTGVSLMLVDLTGKRLELLKEEKLFRTCRVLPFCWIQRCQSKDT